MAGLRVKCLNPNHSVERRCGRYRAAGLGTDTFGKDAPLIVLGAWLQASHDKPTRKSHKQYVLSLTDMWEYAETHYKPCA